MGSQSRMRLSDWTTVNPGAETQAGFLGGNQSNKLNDLGRSGMVQSRELQESRGTENFEVGCENKKKFSWPVRGFQTRFQA